MMYISSMSIDTLFAFALPDDNIMLGNKILNSLVVVDITANTSSSRVLGSKCFGVGFSTAG